MKPVDPMATEGEPATDAMEARRPMTTNAMKPATGRHEAGDAMKPADA